MATKRHERSNQELWLGSRPDVDDVLAEFAGDHRAAIEALLHDLEALAKDHGATVSWGYVRGHLVKLKGRRDGSASG
jgi:hypothetical protein